MEVAQRQKKDAVSDGEIYTALKDMMTECGRELDPDGFCSVSDVASLLTVSTERVRQLAQEGWIPRRGRNRYSLRGAVQGYARFLKGEQRRASKIAAASRVQEARAISLELKNAREAAQLIETKECIAVFDEIIAGLRAGFAGLPAAFTRDLTERARLESMLNDIVNTAANNFGRKATELRRGKSPPANCSPAAQA